MSVTLPLTPDLERQLREKAAQQGQSVEEYLTRLAEAALLVEAPPRQLSAEEWIAEWRAWAASHAHWPTNIDDSRESIYAGRGE